MNWLIKKLQYLSSRKTNNRLSQIFHDSYLQDKLLYDGYFTLPLLTQEQVSKCWKVFKESDKGIRKERYNTLEIADYEYRRYVHHKLKEIIGPTILSYLIDYKFLAFNLAVKRSGDGTGFDSHIDDVHADESKFVSVHVWIPLIDVNSHNGTLYVVPRSHKLPQPISGIGLPYPFKEQEHLIDGNKKYLNMCAGDAIFFHSRLIHGSPTNKAEQTRPAIITGMIPKEADPFVYMHHKGLPEGRAAKLQADEKFFLEASIYQNPKELKCHGYYDYKKIEISNKKLLKILNKQ